MGQLGGGQLRGRVQTLAGPPPQRPGRRSPSPALRQQRPLAGHRGAYVDPGPARGQRRPACGVRRHAQPPVALLGCQQRQRRVAVAIDGGVDAAAQPVQPLHRRHALAGNLALARAAGAAARAERSTIVFLGGGRGEKGALGRLLASAQKARHLVPRQRPSAAATAAVACLSQAVAATHLVMAWITSAVAEPWLTVAAARLAGVEGLSLHAMWGHAMWGHATRD